MPGSTPARGVFHYFLCILGDPYYRNGCSIYGVGPSIVELAERRRVATRHPLDHSNVFEGDLWALVRRAPVHSTGTSRPATARSDLASYLGM